jgi:SAM-dependent methyltransferase
MNGLNDPELNQDSGWTVYDRYPSIFSFVLRNCPDRENLKILSFGCSTGEEVRSLRDIYYPTSKIDGVDFDSDRLSEARNRNKGFNSEFFESGKIGCRKYDVIFALSVLCRNPHKDLAEYPFDTFDRTVSTIDCLLETGGILAAYNIQYHIEESSVGEKFSPIIDRCLYNHYPTLAVEPVLVKKYWKDGTLFTGRSPVIYKKIVD